MALIELEGHADGEGSTVASQQLSEDRARAARRFLASLGVLVTDIRATGMADLEPRTGSSPAANRRVEVLLVPRPPGSDPEGHHLAIAVADAAGAPPSGG